MSFNYSMYVNQYKHVIDVFKSVVDEAPPVEGASFTISEVTVEDVMQLDIREEQRITFDNSSLDFVIRAHAWLNLLTPMNYTLRHGDQILLLASVMASADGVGEISFLVDKNLVNASKIVRFTAIKLFHQGVDLLPFRRLQAKVDATFPAAINFIEKMGFTQEGTLRAHGSDGRDYYMYGLVK